MAFDNKYKQDGVDVVAGDNFSKLAGAVCRASFTNSPYVQIDDPSGGNFRGLRSFALKNLPAGSTMDMTSDGNGTKVIINDAASNYIDTAYDLVEMCAGDITRNGGLPLILNNVLDVDHIGEPGSYANLSLGMMIKALGSVAEQMKMVLFRGETAELGVCVGSDNPKSKLRYNWSATALGVYNRQMLISGDDIVAGDIIIALKEYGFRANGLSSVRAAFSKRFGEFWFNEPDAQELIKQAAVRSELYDPFLTRINGWYSSIFEPLVKVKKLIHVTGGAFEGKLGRDVLFPLGLGADLTNLYSPPPIMRCCKEWRGMSGEECYNTWNCGQGMLAILSPHDAQDFIHEALMDGIQSQICGEVTQPFHESIITISSKFEPETIAIY